MCVYIAFLFFIEKSSRKSSKFTNFLRPMQSSHKQNNLQD